MLEDGDIPHLLFSGVQGSGKTTLALIMINALGIDPVDLLTLNSSDENSVDVMRNKIKAFVSTYATGDFKVIHLEEADYLTPNAQAVLRRVMEEYAETSRFIFTCNYPNKIMPAIRSRCQEFKFTRHDINDVTEYAANILVKEKIKFNLNSLDKYIRVAYPDIRKIINTLQQHSKTGVLLDSNDVDDSGEYKMKLLEYIEKDDWENARILCCGRIAPEEWEDVYRFIYESLDKSEKFKVGKNRDAAIVALAEFLYKHAVSADSEINAAALFIKLKLIGQGQ